MFFSLLTKKQQKSIFRYKPGDVIFRAEETPEGLYFVMKGSVEIYVNGPDGKIILDTPGENMIFGEMAVIDNGRRSATAVARADTICQLITTEDFNYEVDKMPPFLQALFRIMTANLRKMNNRELGRHTPLD